MLSIQVFYFAAIVLGLIGVIWVIVKIVVVRKAHNALVTFLRESTTVTDLKQLASVLARVVIDPETVQKARHLITKELEALPLSYRVQIREGLHQPSTRGREAYVVKLVTDVTKHGASGRNGQEVFSPCSLRWLLPPGAVPTMQSCRWAMPESR